MNKTHQELYRLLVCRDLENEYLDNLHQFIHLNRNDISLKTCYHDGDTILHLIALRGLDEMIDTLRKKFNKLQIKQIVNKKNLSYTTPLHIASCYGYTDVCKKLLNLGANINCVTEQ